MFSFFYPPDLIRQITGHLAACSRVILWRLDYLVQARLPTTQRTLTALAHDARNADMVKGVHAFREHAHLGYAETAKANAALANVHNL